MIRRAHGATRILALAGATALAVYVLGGLCLAVTGCDQALWPCNALVLCVLLRLSRSGLEDALIYVCVVVAGILANLHTGADAFLAMTFGLANAGTVGMAVLLARRFTALRFATAADGWRFCVIVGLGPPAVGTLCAWLAAVSVGAPDPLVTARNWYLSDLLGFLVLAPYGMTLSWRQIARLRVNRPILSAAAYSAGMAVAALGVFLVAKAPMIFALLPLMLAATYRFRLWGAAVSVLIVTTVAVPATVMGHGPLAQVGPAARILLLQGFLAMCALTCVSLAALLNERDIHRSLLERRRRKAGRVADAKARLLSHVSREVRGALTAIIGFGSLIENGRLRPDQIRAVAAAITRHGTLLGALSDDLLDLAMADDGALAVQPEAVDLDEAPAGRPRAA